MMSKSRGRMSKAMADACTRNTHHHLTLQTQLDRLDRQRTRHTKDMQRDVRKIQQGAAKDMQRDVREIQQGAAKDTSPSPSDPPAVVRARTGSASPRRAVSSPQRRSPSPRQVPPTIQRTGGSRFRSESASSVPAAGKRTTLAPSSLLPRRRYRSVNGARSVSGPRRSSVAGAVDVRVSELRVQIVQPSNPGHQQRQPRSQLSVPPDLHPTPVNLPEIVVSNDTAEDPLHLPPPQKTQGPPQKKTPRSRSSSSSPGSDSGSEHLPPPPNSPTSGLPVPRAGRPRRHSMPMMMTSPAAGRPASPRPPPPPSPPDPEPSDSLHVKSSSPRDRSSSFSGIVPARRRGSIPERWGSLAERSKPTSSSRRSSMDMDRLVRDLRYGVLNRELMRAARSGSSLTSLSSSPPTSSSSLWEQLKDCRYLRLPSGYSSEEDISNSD